KRHFWRTCHECSVATRGQNTTRRSERTHRPHGGRFGATPAFCCGIGQRQCRSCRSRHAKGDPSHFWPKGTTRRRLCQNERFALRRQWRGRVAAFLRGGRLFCRTEETFWRVTL